MRRGAGRGFVAASPITALVFGGVVLTLMIAEIPLASLAQQSVNASGGSLPVWFSAPFAVLGFVIAWRKPRNPLGWIVLGIVANWLGMSVAILKYRLYEIDRILSRTVAYAIVTGLLVGVYAGLVLLATRVLPLSSGVAVAGSTLVAAALFSPLRRRVQHSVDHRFNRGRYDAELTTIQRALEPAHLAVWTEEPMS